MSRLFITFTLLILSYGVATLALTSLAPAFDVQSSKESLVLARIGEMAWVDSASDMRDDDSTAECLFNADQTVTFNVNGVVPYPRPVTAYMTAAEDADLRTELAKFSAAPKSDPEPMFNPDTEGFSAMAHPQPLSGSDKDYFNYIPIAQNSTLANVMEKICKRISVPQMSLLRHSGGTRCGVERWSVKTGTDPDVSKINMASAMPVQITDLRAISTPSTLPPGNRILPVEATLYTVRGNLIIKKSESDGDYHLVLADEAGNTIIVEVPDPNCVAAGSPFLAGVTKTRAAVDSNAQLNAGGSFKIPVLVTGVGYFDFIHGQTGVAPNGIELHPVLDIQFNPQ